MMMKLRSRKRLGGLIIAGAALLLLGFFNVRQNPTTTITSQPTGTFRVMSVIDGDTIEVNIDGKSEKVRLLGIDTPETRDPRKTVQCFGAEASRKSHELMDSQNVRLEDDITQGDRDKYGRLLRYVYLSDGRFVNQILIAEGYAHEYTYQSQVYKFQAEFKQAQTEARNAGKGLWAENTCAGNTKQPTR